MNPIFRRCPKKVIQIPCQIQRVNRESPSYDPLNDTKLIVFWSTLLPLCFCLVCRASAHITHTYCKDCAIVVTLFCTSNHETTWCSMPKINGMCAANLLIPLFTGATYSRFNEICDAFGLKCLGKTLYNSIQKKYLFPYIHKIYKTFRDIHIDDITEQGGIDVSGDARCDSPGYSAKYSTCSIMDTVSNQIIHFFVTHVGTIKNSSRMEKAGLIDVLDRVKSLGVTVCSLTTDRHPQVSKYMCEERKDVKHQ